MVVTPRTFERRLRRRDLVLGEAWEGANVEQSGGRVAGGTRATRRPVEGAPSDS
jgi:hypothetical protein